MMAVIEACQASSSPNTTEQWYGRLVDTHGNNFLVPDFTIKQIRSAIPAHCFERSALRGFAYIARDIMLLASIFYLFHHYVIPNNITSSVFRFVFWAIYGFVHGLFATGFWVIAHECGHQSFSPSKRINDTTGWVNTFGTLSALLLLEDLSRQAS